MRIFLLVLSLLFVHRVAAEEVELKYNGIKYVADVERGTARVSKNYTKNKGAVEGDVVIDSIVYYKKKAYCVTSIESLAFLRCDEMSSLTIPNSVVEIDPSSFPLYSKRFSRIVVMPENRHFQSVDGVLFNKKMTELIYYPNGLGASTYVIPSTVVTIGEHAFSSCENLQKIEIPNSVKTIKKKSFYSVTLTEIEIPNGVVEIEDNAFKFSHLHSVKLPASVVRVGEQAFAYCPNLASVIKQNKDMVIHPDAFLSSDKLTAENIVYQVPASLFLELAQKGNPDDQYNLAVCYYNGESFPKDDKLALEWFEKAANQGHMQSQYWTGLLCFRQKQVAGNMEKAVAWMSKAAEAGVADAQTAIGYFYFNGLGVAQNTETALNWFTLAAQQNEQTALTNLGHFYYYGQVTERNVDKAVECYKKVTAADTSVIYNLACCYYQGTGVQKDDKEALRLLDRAVNHGLVQGQRLYCFLNYNEAVSNMNDGLYSSAISRFTSVLKYDQANVDAYINRGYCYLQTETKDYIQAEEDFRSAIALDPGDQVAAKNLKIVSEHNQTVQDALNFLEQGDAYYNQNNYEDAVASYASSIALDDANPHPYYWIGYCYYNCLAYDTAISYFEKALEVDPNYSAAVKAIKNTRTVAAINSVLQAVNTAVVSSLNNAYKSAGSSTTTRSTTSNPSSLSTSKNTYSSGSTVSSSSETDKKEKALCYICDGKGKVSCAHCGGDGKYVDDACPICRGTGRATCSTCYGTGTY